MDGSGRPLAVTPSRPPAPAPVHGATSDATVTHPQIRLPREELLPTMDGFTLPPDPSAVNAW